MDKQTLSQYGWVVICVLVLAVMIAFATPFGDAIEGSIRDTVSTMKGNSQNTLNTAFAEAEGSGGAEAPTMLNGANQVYNKAGASLLSFRSSAPIDTFQSVKVDGSVVDSSNYTVTEGSTIVTFTKEYSQNLADGIHTVEIVSEKGTASANFKTEVTAGLYDADGNMTMSWDELIEEYPDMITNNGKTINALSYISEPNSVLRIPNTVEDYALAFATVAYNVEKIYFSDNMTSFDKDMNIQESSVKEIYVSDITNYDFSSVFNTNSSGKPIIIHVNRTGEYIASLLNGGKYSYPSYCGFSYEEGVSDTSSYDVIFYCSDCIFCVERVWNI